MKSLKKLTTIITVLIMIIATKNVSKSFTVVLDPGHGGIDCGAINGNVHEADVTLKIAKYLKQYLEKYNDVTVSLTHEGIENGELTVFDRAIIARNKNADLFASIHINSSTSSAANGAEVYVSANTSLEKYNKKTTELGNKILANLEKLGITSRGVKTRQLTTDTTDIYSDGTMADYYGIIRYAMRGTKIDYGKIWPTGKEPAKVEKGEGVPSILIEHCFISSNKDIAYIDSDEDIKKIAKADADAIIEYYGLQLPKDIVNVKKDDKKMEIITTPSATIKEITNLLNVTEYSIIDKDGKALDKKNEKIATGYKIKAGNKTYTLIKLGDTDGDGKAIAVDALTILKHSINKIKLEGVYLEAADVSGDGKALATDALAILKDSIGKVKISL